MSLKSARDGSRNTLAELEAAWLRVRRDSRPEVPEAGGAASCLAVQAVSSLLSSTRSCRVPFHLLTRLVPARISKSRVPLDHDPSFNSGNFLIKCVSPSAFDYHRFVAIFIPFQVLNEDG
mmetsp:Transcript_72826/g.121564  ORF Transcript_72826/g.121564 Transcript_72826/m.121564 type:complete len:120 (-) Transcript_72826:308-667(-)